MARNNMEKDFRKRIDYYGDLKEISLKICSKYNLEKFISNNIILVGYEDFNFVLETTTGKFFVKVFAKSRTLKNCKRCIEILEKVINLGVSTPKLLKSKESSLFKTRVDNVQLRLCVMDFIEGETIYDSDVRLNDEEIKFVSKQLALINSVSLNPKKIYDSWSVENFIKEYKKKSKYLSENDLKLIKPLIKKFKDLKIKSLPHCFAHGDVISTNVLRDKNGKLWIIDFSVANYCPRIQEISVFACNLIFYGENLQKNQEKLDIAINEYEKIQKLTSIEKEELPTYISICHAMHILCANYEKVVNKNNSKENEYWLNEGRIGLKSTFPNL